MLKRVEEVETLLGSGRFLLLAGSEETLSRLPKGGWIGGTIPYFMASSGGKVSKDLVFVNELPSQVTGVELRRYGRDSLDHIPADAPENGFTFLLVPGMSEVHIAYAHNAPNFEGIFMKPIIGWITGVHLDDLGIAKPKVFDGTAASETEALALHCALEPGYMAKIGIVNLFTQGKDDDITFESEGFTVRDCVIRGRRLNLARHIRQNGIDTRLPLVANYCGAMVNVSVQSVGDEEVILFAPVFRGVTYRFAEPIHDYVEAFESSLPKQVNPVFSCNCILNFVYSELEGKRTKSMYGPVTFGEIAYVLLNQTLVYLEIVKVS